MPFNGLAVYDNFTAMGEDVSDVVALLAPMETPLLDIIGASDRPATSVKHEWIEDTLNPTTDVLSTAVASTGRAAGDQVGLNVAHSTRFRIGDLVQMGAGTTRETLLVNSAFSANTIGAVSGYGGSTIVNSVGAGSVVEIIGNAALEGEDTDEDLTVTQGRVANYTQIFKAGIKISGTALAASWTTTSNKLAEQKMARLRELLVQLEKSVLLGRTSTNTIGSDVNRRTMAGIVASLSTNIQSWGTFTESGLSNMLQLAYNQGSRSIDVLVVPPDTKRLMSAWNANRIHIVQNVPEGRAREDWFRSLVSVYESDFGVQQVVMNRWLSNTQVKALALDSSRIKVVPLAGRSFAYEELAKGGDHIRGQVVGEYTLEFRNENAHSAMV
jgi:hypothetical protein